MLQLNDDCLCQIFLNLTVKEQLALTAVSERFSDVLTELIWRRKFRELLTNSTETDELTNEEYQTLFSLIVPNIEKFTIADTKHLAFTSYLGRYTWRPELTFYLSFQFPRLREFHCQDRRIHDGHVRLIAEKCPKLQVFRISSEWCTGAHIKDMRNLRELHMPSCSLNAEHLREIMLTLNLTHLDVSNCEKLDLSILKEVTNTKLIWLKLSATQLQNELLDILQYLNNLKYLQVNAILENSTENTTPWSEFVERYNSRIKELTYINAYEKDLEALKILSTYPHFAQKLKNLHIFRNFEVLQLLEFSQNLEHIYVDKIKHGALDSWHWLEFILRRSRFQPNGKVLTVHLGASGPQNLVLNMFKQEIEQTVDYRQQDTVKFQIGTAETVISAKESYVEFLF